MRCILRRHAAPAAARCAAHTFAARPANSLIMESIPSHAFPQCFMGIKQARQATHSHSITQSRFECYYGMLRSTLRVRRLRKSLLYNALTIIQSAVACRSAAGFATDGSNLSGTLVAASAVFLCCRIALCKKPFPMPIPAHCADGHTNHIFSGTRAN